MDGATVVIDATEETAESDAMATAATEIAAPAVKANGPAENGATAKAEVAVRVATVQTDLAVTAPPPLRVPRPSVSVPDAPTARPLWTSLPPKSR